jgi:hypothetical protein
MMLFRNRCLLVMVAVLSASCAGAAKRPAATDLLDRAQEAVVRYIDKLAEVHCIEDVEQLKLRPNGSTEAAFKTEYDYFVLLQGNSIDFQLAESRLPLTKTPQRKEPMLLSNGFSMLLLIFHPYFRNGFTFTPEGQEEIAGLRAIRYHFAHIAGARSPAALALRDREYPLDLQGSAWIEAETGQPLRIDAELLHPMTDIGLRSLTAHVEYAAITKVPGSPFLVTLADVDVETQRQHWRNSHVFHKYMLFSADASQDPHVKVHPDPSDSENPRQSPPKEKP